MAHPCIVCLGEVELTRSHVIPASVGGRWVAPLECEPCNRRIGAQFESKLKFDPGIRTAIERLAPVLPGLSSNMRKRGSFLSRDEHVSVAGRWDGATFAVRDTPQPDGSIVKSDRAAEQDLRSRLRRSGADD